MFVAAFTYSMVSGFVLSSASRNRREGRANPPVVDYVGYGLIGVTIAMIAILFYMAAMGISLPEA